MTQNLRVSLDFAGYSDSDLYGFGSNVVMRLTGNAAFPTPPITLANLQTLLDAFQAALLAAMPGGIQLTAAKNAARSVLMDALRQVASYVQIVANKSLDVLLTSGFYANSTNRAQTPLDPPSITQLANLGSTQVLMRLSPITNARSYNVQISSTPNTWQDAGIFTQARRIVLGNLTPAVTYTIRARAIGGSTGASDWSSSLSIMAT
jgi:hypothetical protein